jgi:hypothetical protein
MDGPRVFDHFLEMRPMADYAKSTAADMRTRVMGRLERGSLSGHDQGGMVIAAGPITKQPITVPFRVVIIQLDDGFAVGRQNWADWDIINYDKGGWSSVDWNLTDPYVNGCSYFGLDQLPAVMEEFGKQVAGDAACAASVYRDDNEA